MREGNPAWGVPAYNGALFHPSALEGAALLERIQLADPEFARVLIALGIDKVEGRGVDYSSLEIGHLGHIYESLLSLNLSVTVQPVRYDPHKDEYRHVHQTGGIPAGSLLWQTNEGGRKVGGVYYTPTALVRHLVDRTVRPAYREHLAEVQKDRCHEPSRKQRRTFWTSRWWTRPVGAGISSCRWLTRLPTRLPVSLRAARFRRSSPPWKDCGKAAPEAMSRTWRSSEGCSSSTRSSAWM